MMSEEFKAIAYKRTVLLFIRRTLHERSVQVSDTASLIICEEVPYADRIVPFESFDEVLSHLDTMIEELSKELTQFSHKREVPNEREK